MSEAARKLGSQSAILELAFEQGIEKLASLIVCHWLMLANSLSFLVVALSLLAPYLMSLGATSPAHALYFGYRFLCHQVPSRSYLIFGHQVAICQRDLAIFSSILLAGLLFNLVRNRVKPLKWCIYLLLVIPIAIDGFTQLLGWRESNWQLRTLVGALFGLANVGLVYPFMERGMQQARASLTQGTLRR